jgi:hypothetical protein
VQVYGILILRCDFLSTNDQQWKSLKYKDNWYIYIAHKTFVWKQVRTSSLSSSGNSASASLPSASTEDFCCFLQRGIKVYTIIRLWPWPMQSLAHAARPISIAPLLTVSITTYFKYKDSCTYSWDKRKSSSICRYVLFKETLS